jgi:dipeptide transport system ATP-binding protein
MQTESQFEPGKSGAGLRVIGLSKTYSVRHQFWRKSKVLVAARDITFEIPAGQTVAMVGGSGSGKSTVARCVTRLERPDTGEIWVNGQEIAQLPCRDLRRLRGHIQMIFQDPITSMNPRMSAAEIIEEPWLIQDRGNAKERRSAAAEVMERVGLAGEWIDRRITEFSGGQQQRIAIARALMLSPRILIFDEALSGLDLETQAQISELLIKLQRQYSLAYLLISHDLDLVAHMADELVVMARGHIVEYGKTAEIIANPQHSETQSLVAAAEHFRRGLAKAQGTSA